MKNFLNWFLPLVILVLVGCTQKQGKVIRSKYHNSMQIGETYMPKGLCRFYDNDGNQFEDSCHYYFVGDTITNHRPR